jgi:hypothetical protein
MGGVSCEDREKDGGGSGVIKNRTTTIVVVHFLRDLNK